MDKIKLLPCPFCGGEAEIERYGDRKQSTIYACTNCGCRLETGEEWNHGTDWNRRTEPVKQKVVVNWKEYPENKPIQDGYYMTIYSHPEGLKYKGIWWSNNKQEWIKWHPKAPEPLVQKFIPETWAKYYTQCIKLTKELEGYD